MRVNTGETRPGSSLAPAHNGAACLGSRPDEGAVAAFSGSGPFARDNSCLFRGHYLCNRKVCWEPSPQVLPVVLSDQAGGRPEVRLGAEWGRYSMGPPAPVEASVRLLAWRVNAVEIPMFGPVLYTGAVAQRQHPRAPCLAPLRPHGGLGLVSSDTYRISGKAPALSHPQRGHISEGTVPARESG